MFSLKNKPNLLFLIAVRKPNGDLMIALGNICPKLRTKLYYKKYIESQTEHSTFSSVDEDNSIYTRHEWLVNNKRHRIGKPAMIVIYHNDVTMSWMKNNKLHRKNGPAVQTCQSGVIKKEFWYTDGLLHRENGPAMINNHTQIYYENGVLIKIVKNKENTKNVSESGSINGDKTI